jgi:hypothetical protein
MQQNLVFNFLQLALLNILLVSCGIPNSAQHQRDVANLPKVFNTLQTLKVNIYMSLFLCLSTSIYSTTRKYQR